MRPSRNETPFGDVDDGYVTVLYEKIYRGVPTQGGGLRLLAYYERRIPLAHMQMELRAVGHEKEWKGAA